MSGTLKYFWYNGIDIPPELITRNFSFTHLAWVFAALLFVVVETLHFRRQSAERKRFILRLFAVMLVALEVSTWIWSAVMGCYTPADLLPLHLCGFSIFLEALAVFSPRSSFLKECTYALSLPSALFAVLTPGWFYPFLTFRYLDSALLHTILMLIPVLLVWGEGFRPDWRRLPKCFGLLLLFAGIAKAANDAFGGNYMFLRFAPDDTLLAVFRDWCGTPGYLLPVIGLLLILWVIMYLPWVILGRKKKKERELAQAASR